MRRRLLPFLPLLAFIASDAEAGQRPDLDVWLGSGAAAPVGGCSPCPEVVPEGAYRIAEGRAAWVPGSGRVEVSDAAVVITYETSDGSTWEVEYRRVERAE